jgi:PAS domain-containing protein
VAEAVGVVGAAHIIRSKQTGQAEWISLSGPTAEFKAEYVTHYSALDPYAAVIEAAPRGSWLQLSERLPKTVLCRNEWYNEFVLRCGLGDMLGAWLFESRSHRVIFGLHQDAEQAPFAPVPAARLQELLDEVGKAARLHYQLRSLDWESAVALRALDQLATGVIVTDGAGWVIELNRAAERIVRRNDGLTVRNGQLCARRAFEAVKLARLISAAAAEHDTGTTPGRMVVGRRGDRPYVLTVAPLGAELAVYGRPFAMVLVADPEELCQRRGTWLTALACRRRRAGSRRRSRPARN